MSHKGPQIRAIPPAASLYPFLFLSSIYPHLLQTAHIQADGFQYMADRPTLPKHCLMFLSSQLPHGQIWRREGKAKRKGAVPAGQTQCHSANNAHCRPWFLVGVETCQRLLQEASAGVERVIRSDIKL